MPCPGGGSLFRSRRTPSSAGQCRGTGRDPRGISFAARTVISASPALSGGLSGGEWTLPVSPRQSGEEKVRETCRSSSAFCQPYHHPFFSAGSGGGFAHSPEEAPAAPSPKTPAAAPWYPAAATAIHDRVTPGSRDTCRTLPGRLLRALSSSRGGLLLCLRGDRGNTGRPAAPHSPSCHGSPPEGTGSVTSWHTSCLLCSRTYISHMRKNTST